MKRLLLFLIIAGMTACTYHYDNPQRGGRGQDAGSFQVRHYPNAIGQVRQADAAQQIGNAAATIAARSELDSAAILLSGQLAEMNDSIQIVNARLEYKLDAVEKDMRRLQWMLAALLVLMAGLVVSALRFMPRRAVTARHRENQDSYSHINSYGEKVIHRDW